MAKVKVKRVLFFDSGVGGLSVYARFREVLPNEDTIYFGDLKNSYIFASDLND